MAIFSKLYPYSLNGLSQLPYWMGANRALQRGWFILSANYRFIARVIGRDVQNLLHSGHNNFEVRGG